MLIELWPSATIIIGTGNSVMGFFGAQLMSVAPNNCLPAIAQLEALLATL